MSLIILKRHPEMKFVLTRNKKTIYSFLNIYRPILYTYRQGQVKG